jgi:hypothetical protein
MRGSFLETFVYHTIIIGLIGLWSWGVEMVVDRRHIPRWDCAGIPLRALSLEAGRNDHHSVLGVYIAEYYMWTVVMRDDDREAQEKVLQMMP